MSAVEAAAEEHKIAFLASDVDADGGKLILTAGAPRLRATTKSACCSRSARSSTPELPIPIRIGVHRGSVFAGDIGPCYRRTYTVMGDAVNLAARLMAKAEPGQIYATADVLDRSNTLFETTELEPFAVKGKARAGPGVVGRPSAGFAHAQRVARAAAADRARCGTRVDSRGARERPRGRGTARSRSSGSSAPARPVCCEALREDAAGFRKLHVACEAYYRVHAVCACGASCCASSWVSDATTRRRRSWSGCAARWRPGRPTSLPWLPLIGDRVRRRDRADAGGRDAGRNEPATEAARSRRAVPRGHDARAGRSSRSRTRTHMDMASAELLSYVTGQCGARPWLWVLLAARPTPGSRRPTCPR